MNDFNDRKDDMRNHKPERKSARRAAAQSVSRVNHRAKKAQLIYEALAQFVIVLYETDEVGYTSFDLDGRILISAPWSKRNHKSWGLRRLEANVLRHIMKEESRNEAREPLFYFDNFRWYINTNYRGKSQAMAWVEAVGINANRWERGRLAVTDETARQWAL